MPNTLKWNEQWVKGLLEDYFNEGDSELTVRKEDYDKAKKMYDLEYRNTNLPDDTIFYPTIRNHVMQIQRAISQTYRTIKDNIDAHPEIPDADKGSGEFAEAIKKIMNAQFNDRTWRNKAVTIDKSALQGAKYGGCHGYVTWIEEIEEVPIVEKQMVPGDDGLPEEIDVVVGTEERILDSRMDIGRINHEDLLWDTNADDWSEIAWAMRVNIHRTKRELQAMKNIPGYNGSRIDEIIAREHPITNEKSDSDQHVAKAQENQVYDLIEFYGYIPLEENGKSKFVKIVATSDYDIILAPNNSRDHVYTWLTGKPMIPYVVGYLYPKDDSVVGESLLLLGEAIQKEENAMRNFIRRMAEESLYPVWTLRRGSGIDHNKLQERKGHRVLWSDGDARQAVSQFTMRDTSGVGFNDLAMIQQDAQRTYGNTDYTMGISDPSLTDTATGISLMQTAANTIVYYFIKSFNDTFIEPMFERALHLTIQFIPEEVLATLGVKEELRQKILDNNIDVKLTVDSEQGATSSIARKKSNMESYFMLQQAIGYCAQTGLVVTPEMMIAPLHVLKEQLELNGIRASDKFIPDPEEILKLSQARAEAAQKQQQADAEQQKATAEQGLEDARNAGGQAAMEQMIKSEGSQNELAG